MKSNNYAIHITNGTTLGYWQEYQGNNFFMWSDNFLKAPHEAGAYNNWGTGQPLNEEYWVHGYWKYAWYQGYADPAYKSGAPAASQWFTTTAYYNFPTWGGPWGWPHDRRHRLLCRQRRE